MRFKIRIVMILAVFVGVAYWVQTTVCANAAYAEVIFIVNNSVPDETLSKADVKEIFLGDKVSWGNGQEIKFVTLKKSPTHMEFTKKYTRKSESQFLRYWKKQVFTGKGSMPKSFDSDGDMVKFVANTDGAVGYISPATAAQSVKTITISE